MKKWWNYSNLLKRAIKGVNIEKINLNDEKELKKFRENIAEIMKDIFSQPPDIKNKAIQAIKVGVFELMSQIPVITPVITAMLQTITSEDLSSKIDNLSKELGSKMDENIKLSKKILSVLDERLPPR